MGDGKGTAYSKGDYRVARAAMLRSGAGCVYCGRPATTLDHVPALTLHAHEPGTGCCELHPCCSRCNSRGGQRIAARRRRHRTLVRAALDVEANPSRRW
jgi:5-methylcytosine-specific restriction endonuclease McrA